MENLERTLARLDGLLSSRPDRTRWKGAIALGELAETDPELAWPLVVKHGSADMQTHGWLSLPVF